MVKNNSIPFWRLIFTLLIAVFHFLRLYGMNTGWYIGVEFFFITSGFLLIYTCEKNQSKNVPDSPWTYTKRRICRLYPMYLFCFIINFGFYSTVLYPTTGMKLQALLTSIYEVIGIQMIGLDQTIFFNNVAWYVSALLITGYFIYYMVLNHKKFYIQVICPLSVLFIYSFYYREYSGLEMWGTTKGFLQHDALLRAFAGMNLGILSYQLCNKIKKLNLSKLGEIALDIAEIVLFTFIIIYTAIVHNTNNDYAMVIFMSVGIALSFGHRHCTVIFNNKVINALSNLTYAMYLNHRILLSIFKRVNLPGIFSAVLFLITLVIMSVIATFIVDKCVIIIKKIGSLFLKTDSAKTN